MLITPINVMYGLNSNNIYTYDEDGFNSTTSRMALIYSDNKSLFRIKSGSTQHYIEPYFFGVKPGAKFKIEFEARMISGNPSVDIQLALINEKMVVGSMRSGLYKFDITETYFKKYKIIVAMPEGMNNLQASGVIFNIRATSTNSVFDMRNLNIDIIDNPGICIPKIKGVCYNNIIKFKTMLDGAESIHSNIRNVMSYGDGVIQGSGDGFKGVLQHIDDTIYDNKIMISGQYMSDSPLEIASNLSETKIELNATSSWSKFTKIVDVPNRHNTTDNYVWVGTTATGTVKFKDLKIVDIANDDTFI